jgi:Ribbon-helix-helix protein, copG family
MPRVTVVLTDDQLARLDTDAAALGISRSEAIRRRLDDARPVKRPKVAPPTREATLLKLEKAAAAGSVVAMTTIMRELRLGGPTEPEPAVEQTAEVDELTAWRRFRETRQ